MSGGPVQHNEMKFTAFAATDKGKKREVNEDVFLIDLDNLLFIISDGMGGQAGGELAAQTTVSALHEHIKGNISRFRRRYLEPDGRQRVLELIDDAVQHACRTVYDLSRSKPGYVGMGATMTLLFILGHHGFMAHVGDSRLYLKRRGMVQLLSRDQTLAADLVSKGLLDPKEARTHQSASVLLQAIGEHPAVQVETFSLEVLAEDTYMLCTDGLSAYLNGHRDLLPFLTRDDLASVPRELVRRALDGGGRDNVTALVVRASAKESHQRQQEQRTGEFDLTFDRVFASSLFNTLIFRELVMVLSLADIKRYEPGEPVVEEQEENDSIYIVLEGQLSLSIGGRPMRYLNPGGLYGDSTLLKVGPVQGTLQAVQPTRVLSIKTEQLNDLLKRHPRMGNKILKNLALRFYLRLEHVLQELVVD
ncbi:MAG: cyclic nucleotide-binding domain-containing protein [Myxococcales bacterium]|nr:cyclic nucleotide-binding domain-containing protein [Myxococcales bacterium]